jgi:hypothetical protein
VREFLRTTWEIIREPQAFFECSRVENWWPSYRYFFIVAVVLSILSPLAWALGIDGSSPVNTSLMAQRDTYRWWQDTLQPQFGGWSYLLGMVTLLVTTNLVLLVWTPIMHVIFRLLGGQGPLLNAWKAICYGMAPTVCLGFLPFFGLLTGVYAMLLQLCLGPATLYRLRDGRAYVLVVIVLSIALYFFWQGIAP